MKADVWTPRDEDLGRISEMCNILFQSTLTSFNDSEFLDDAGCSAAIKKAHSEELAAHFENEQVGMYKSDICRLAQLALHCGYYMNADYQALEDVRNILPPLASFVSVIALPWRSTSPRNPKEMFQAFLAAAPEHPVIRSSVDKCMDFYEGRNETLVKMLGGSDTIGLKGTLHGTLFVRLAYEEWLGQPMQPGLQEQLGESAFKYSYLLE